ncbi:MAG: hypothetical protein U1E10_05145 [Bdellovibrionales bacterium]|nr:hypothetical protein [Bdellovibrionales bacterium]
MSKKPPVDQNDNGENGKTNGPVAEEIGAEEVVLERRIERRLREMEASDRPWLRRIVGSLIIVGSVYIGWKLMGSRIQYAKQEVARLKEQIPAPTPAPKPSDGLASPQATAVAPAPELAELETGGARLDADAATTISECTKGVEAFRLLNLDAGLIAQGTLTLEQTFAPVLKEERGRVKRTTSLENIRIRTRDGRELRLHITPRDQKGRLFAQLFQVAGDGLPEEVEFPTSLASLKTNPITNEMRLQFLQFADTPGVPIETERHESWSFADKSGVQLIVSNDFIFDMQVFTKDRFLACVRANGKSVCKCIEKK